MIGRLIELERALPISRLDAIDEIVKKSRDILLDTTTGGAWNLYKSFKEIFQRKEQSFKKFEELAEWSHGWRSELRRACCCAKVAVQSSSMTPSHSKSVLEIADEELSRVEREFDECLAIKRSKLLEDDSSAAT